MGIYEIQILDSYENETYHDGQAGAIYKQTPPQANVTRPPGEWNTYDVVYRGTRLIAYLNGRLLHDVDTTALKPDQGEPFLNRAAAGSFGLQRHAPAGKAQGDSYAAFRNLFVRELN